MERIRDRALAWMKKFKYPILILLVGILLIIIPFGSRTETDTTARTEETRPALQDALESILSGIEGVGQARVLLTDETGTQTVYQTDTTAQSEKTVTVKSNTQVDTGLVKQIIPETYKGALVVCEGADNPSVRLAVTDAVSKLTGLGADKISVQKMK